MSDNKPPCTKTREKNHYSAGNDDSHGYICSHCGQTMRADRTTYMNGVSEKFRQAMFRYAGHYFYWRGN